MAQAGRYRDKIVIQAPGSNLDTNNQPLDTPWTDYATVWANVVISTGDEVVEQGQLTATVNYSIEIRYSATLAAIKPEYRIIYENKVLQIHSVLPVGNMRREIQISASTIVG